jgi:predicted lactoylglutathione lyase
LATLRSFIGLIRLIMSIISHVSVGATPAKFEEMIEFYDSVMHDLGAKRQMVVLKSGEHAGVKTELSEDVVAVAYGKYYPEFWVNLPEDKKAQSAGNGVHVAFSCPNKAKVDQVYSTAIGAGATSNGEPGPRSEYSDKYYGAFFIDPCGNKLEAVFFDMGILNYCNIL